MHALVEKKCNSYKIVAKLLQDLARECINIDKLLQKFLQELCLLQNFCNGCVFFFAKFLQELCLLQNFCKSSVFFAKFLQELYSVWMNLFHNVFVIALKESNSYVSKFRVFLYQNVNGILQSIQNQPFRIGAVNDRNVFI